MSRSRTHVVIGGGPVGLAVVEQLLGSGEQPVLVSRSAKTLPAGAQQIEGSVTDPEVRNQIDPRAVLYHCANAPYHRWAEELPPLWSSVLELAEERKAKLVVATNLYAFGKPDAPLTETHPKHPCSKKGRVRHAVEQSVLDSAAEGDVDAEIVRASDFFGPGVHESVLGERVFEALVAGKAPTFTGSLDQPHSYTFVRDFARTLVAVAENERRAGEGNAGDGNTGHREWIVPNAPARTGREIAEILSKIAGRPVKAKSMGKLMLSIGGIFIPAARETVEMLYEFDAPFVADGTKAREHLGVEPTDFETALAETVEWWERQSEDAADPSDGPAERSRR